MIYLELLRNDEGAIVDIVPIAQGTIHARDGGGYLQVINGRPVADLEEHEVLALPGVFDGREPTKEEITMDNTVVGEPK